MCTEQRKIPKLNTLREDVSQNLQRKWFASLLEPVNLLSVFSGKNGASHSHALSRSSQFHGVNVEGVVTPAQGDARISLILLV